ncbi:MAG: WG repeat-containing protein [Paludibacteraceae bacterium]|nr:WG repeat-containing protein [Paludibacteraceae bacterium]
MQIHDLTNGKYANLTSLISGKHLDQLVMTNYRYTSLFNRNFLFNRYYLGTIEEKQMALLQEVPVFLVDRGMAGQFIQIPGTEVSMQIPLDSFPQEYYEVAGDAGEECLRRLRHQNDDTCEGRECEPLPEDDSSPFKDEVPEYVTAIVDLLGVYVTARGLLMPERIFVWVDKVLECASYDQENAHALLEQVILHEYAHALLDVELYELRHTRYFSYEDYLYRYIEEACANAISLAYGMDSWSNKQQTFIENFVKRQPKEYAAGWDLCCNHRSYIDWFEFWMQTKVHVGRKEVDILEYFWQHGQFKCGCVRLSYRDLYVYNNKDIFLVESCGDEMWAYRTKQNSDLLGLIRIADIPSIICPQKYTYYGAFDSNNLCWVCLEQGDDELFGCINDAGQDVIPCIYESPVEFNNGIAKVEKDGEKFCIDTNNNRIP